MARRGRPPKDTVAVLIRVPRDWQRRTERLIRFVDAPGVGSRQDVYRRAIEYGLEALERAAATAKRLGSPRRQRREEPTPVAEETVSS